MKKTLAGTWTFDSSEGLDEFLQEMGEKFKKGFCL
jgi:hypothetical protein